MQDAVQLLSEMIRLKSVNPPGNEEPVARLMEAHLRKSGLQAEVMPFGNNRANLIGRIKGNGEKKSLVFSGHMDTVPPGDIRWEFDPCGAVEHQGRIYGRGASDMKSGLAAMVLAFAEVARSGAKLKGDLVLAATAGEEVDCIGAKKMVSEGLLRDAGAMVISEPSNLQVFIAHKGALWVEVHCYGKTAHGSMPEQGINAIEHMNGLMNALQDRFRFHYETHDLLGTPTLNISMISGGVKTNVVPDVCRLQLDIRTVPGQDHASVLQDLQTLVQELEQETSARFEIQVLNDLPPVHTMKEEPLVKTAIRTARDVFQEERVPKGVRYFTDASAFVPGLGGELPVIICGPGDEKLAHQPNEYVEVDKYLASIRFYQELAMNWLC